MDIFECVGRSAVYGSLQHRAFRHFTYALVGIPYITLGICSAASVEFVPLVGGEFGFLDGTPALAVTVESAVAGYGNIRFVAGRDRRSGAVGRKAFPIRSHYGIVGKIFAEKHQSSAVKVEIHIAFQTYGAGVPDAFGHIESATALFGKMSHSLCESFGVECHSVVDASEISYRHRIVGYHGSSHSRKLDGKILVIALVAVGGKSLRGGHSHAHGCHGE